MCHYGASRHFISCHKSVTAPRKPPNKTEFFRQYVTLTLHASQPSRWERCVQWKQTINDPSGVMRDPTTQFARRGQPNQTFANHLQFIHNSAWVESGWTGESFSNGKRCLQKTSPSFPVHRRDFRGQVSLWERWTNFSENLQVTRSWNVTVHFGIKGACINWTSAVTAKRSTQCKAFLLNCFRARGPIELRIVFQMGVRDIKILRGTQPGRRGRNRYLQYIRG